MKEGVEKKGSGQTGPLQPSRPSIQQADWPWPIIGWPRATPDPAHPSQTHVPQVEGDFQLTPEAVCEGRVHVQHLQQVCPLDLVQVTVGQGPYICAGLARPGMKANGLSKDVILSCQPEGRGNLQGLALCSLLRSLPEDLLTLTLPSFRVPARQGPGTRLDVLRAGSVQRPLPPQPVGPLAISRILETTFYQNFLPVSHLLGNCPYHSYPGNSRQKRHQSLHAQPLPLWLATELQSGGDQGSGAPSSLGQHLRLLSLWFPLPLWGQVTGMALSAPRCPHL